MIYHGRPSTRNIIPPLTSADLGHGEALNAPRPPNAAPDRGVPPPIVASNYRPIGKGTLLGSVALFVTKWRFEFHGCLWHRKGDEEWIALPGREWVDGAGKRQFASLGKFLNHGDQKRFKEEALKAIRRLVDGSVE